MLPQRFGSGLSGEFHCEIHHNELTSLSDSLGGPCADGHDMFKTGLGQWVFHPGGGGNIWIVPKENKIHFYLNVEDVHQPTSLIHHHLLFTLEIKTSTYKLEMCRHRLNLFDFSFLPSNYSIDCFDI